MEVQGLSKNDIDMGLVQSERVPLLYQNLQTALAATVVVAVIYAIRMWSVAPHASIVRWLGALFLVLIVRLYLSILYKKHSQQSHEDFEQWLYYYQVLLAVTGLIWGVGGSWIALLGGVETYDFLTFCLGGLVVGSIGTLSLIYSAFVVYILSMLVPVAILFAIHPSFEYQIMAALVLVATAALIFVVHKFNDVLNNSLILNIKNNHMIISLQKAQNELEQLAMRDGLTGLLNRRVLEEQLDLELERCRRYKRELSVIMVDVDYFKQVNDTHGHAEGDQVLKRLAVIMNEVSRKVDVVTRVGGEEFVLLLPETSLDGGKLFAERLRQRMEEELFVSTESTEFKVTISIGVAVAPQHGNSSREILLVVDKALYEAKETGRNRVCIAEELLLSKEE